MPYPADTVTTTGAFLLVLALVVPVVSVLLAFVAGGRHAERIALATLPRGLAVAVAIAVMLRRTGGPLDAWPQRARDLEADNTKKWTFARYPLRSKSARSQRQLRPRNLPSANAMKRRGQKLAADRIRRVVSRPMRSVSRGDLWVTRRFGSSRRTLGHAAVLRAGEVDHAADRPIREPDAPHAGPVLVVYNSHSQIAA